ncbi:MAG: LysR family transcriptional regulator [Bdellovibrionaceae bacterium]|nr:LysR family transcriptional regulator [Pseudobdellovibrionaceae bacterium]
MKDLNEIVCFVRVAEEKSITAAARTLDLPKSTVSRKLAALERRLGLTLMKRTTRQVRLTDAGQTFFEKAVRALAELDSAETDLSAHTAAAQGTLRVTAPVEFSTGAFLPLCAEFMRQFPLIEIDLLLTDRLVDLIGENVDVAFRLGHLKDSTLIGRRLGFMDLVLYASPEYLKREGQPRTPEDLNRHTAIGFTPNGAQFPWTLKSDRGKRVVRPKWRFSSNHILAVREAAITHLGIALLPRAVAETDVREKRLKAVLPDWVEVGIPLNVVFAGQRFVPPKLREFLKFVDTHADQICRR